MSVNELVQWLKKYSVQQLCLNSRAVEAGDAFFVLAGMTHDATRFIPQALENGATAFLIEAGTECTREEKKASLPTQPYLIVPGLRAQLSALAAAWYATPSEAINVIGITGTNGKTSSAQWIAKGLEQVGRSAGTIGTLGCTGLAVPPKHEYTTPDVLSLHRWLRLFADYHMDTVAVEMSSHALDQRRADDVHFHTALFTNLSRDHLDYHASFEEYGEAKARLFTHHRVDRAVINLDDTWGQELACRWKRDHAQAPLITFGLQHPAELNATVLETPAGLELKLKTSYGSDTVLLPYLNGRFNASNVLGVMATWLHLGLDWNTILTVLPRIESVPGRMNKFGGRNGAPTIIVDYAHTPDALEKVLLALHPLRDSTGGKLWCIFGAGGDRDHGKRPLMGMIASNFADRVVVTSDNPRSEEPKAIAEQIYEGIPTEMWPSVTIEVDRREAIAQTLAAATTNDVVLIAGKGHEPYQEINGVKIPFSDAEEVQAWLSRKEARL